MKITCDYCYRMCEIEEGKRGYCGIRENRGGEAITVNYGNVLAAAADPIEKKPLYHVRPGQKTLSVALFGCNYACSFCQNHDLSQRSSPLFPAPWKDWRPEETEPEELVKRMNECGLSMMSFTYSEPIVWQNYMLDAAKLVKEQGGINSMVTNGSFSPAALKRILPYIDAYNIDLKGDEAFYKHYCKSALQPVLDGIETIASHEDKIIEITTLLIEGIHRIDDVYWLGEFLSRAGIQVWHLSRFFPHYRMENREPTSERFLQEALQAASSCGIPYIYAGNSSNPYYSKTRCPNCSKEIVSRRGYYVQIEDEVKKRIQGGHCANCGHPIYGIFDQHK